MAMNLRAGLLVLVVAACGPQPAGVVQNVASPANSHLTIAPDQALGWLGIAPLPARDLGRWIPAGPQAVIVPLPADGLASGVTLSAIGVTGGVAHVTAGAPTKVPYGCENQQIDVLAFTGDRFAPGPVWLLPPSVPASWHPAPLAIVSPASATETQRRDTVGPLSLELARTDDLHGTLTIVRDGRALHKVAIERGQMDGADLSPLDFREGGVGIPVPVAAWSFADGGPILLVLHVPSYEGLELTPILIDDQGGRELSKMAHYLYQCAF
jgi:hypothetical protein